MSSTLFGLSCEPFRAWNRLEVRARKKEFDNVLRAEIHDPLWMLTRQWQFGEFQGEDTGSAIFAKIKIETARIARFKQPNGVITAYENDIPLEARVERMPVQYDIRFRARAGQLWLSMIRRLGLSYNTTHALSAGMPGYWDEQIYRSLFAEIYSFELPVIDHDTEATAVQLAKSRLLANKSAHQYLTSLGGRTPDGAAFYEALVLNVTADVLSALPAEITSHASYQSAHGTFILEAAQEYYNWFVASHLQPENANDTCWAPANLEYKFACSMPNVETIDNTVLEANEYYQGHLDWYAFDHTLHKDSDDFFDRDTAEANDYTHSEVLTLIPTEARFGGMPNSRWWQFEDGYVDLGNITADTTNVAKILLAEFALMYSNDWFVVPYVVPAGSISEIKGIIVTDTFGQKTLVESAGQGDSNDWTGWTMFNLSRNSASENLTGKTDPRVLIPPAAAKMQESKPLETVHFLRDEMANMIWAVEEVIPDLLGGGQSGNGAAQAYQNWLRNLERSDTPAASSIPEDVKLKYSLGNTVPENWIPFLPTHLPGENRAIQLQRASMPRWFNGEFSPVRPVTSILRQGMNNDDLSALMPFVNPDEETQLDPYYIYEEEVPRAGVSVSSTWQRTRWYDGKIVCWYGRSKESGRGEGSSGLTFDTVVDVDYENQEALVPAEQ